MPKSGSAIQLNSAIRSTQMKYYPTTPLIPFSTKVYKDVLPTMIGPNGRPKSGTSGPYINFKFDGTTFSCCGSNDKVAWV